MSQILLIGWILGVGLAVQFDDTLPELECTTSTMKVTWDSAREIESLYVGGDSYKGSALCKATSTTTLTWLLHNCGTAVTYSDDTDKLVYTNTVYGVPVDDDPSGIDRGHVLKVLVACEYDRTGNTLTANWKAGQSSTEETDTGTFTFHLKGYDDSDMESGSNNDLDDGGVVILRQKLYFNVDVDVPSDLDVGMTITDISAHTTTDQSGIEYKIAEDGCYLDNTYQLETATSDLNRKFSFDAFYFSGQATDPVYIIVYLKLCKHTGSADDSAYLDCINTCLNDGAGLVNSNGNYQQARKRRKRMVTEESAALMGNFSVYGGPYTIIDPDALGARGDATAISPGILLLLLSTLLAGM